MKKNHSFLNSLSCAIKGLLYIYNTEKNFRFHIYFTFFVLISSFIFRINIVEFVIIMLQILIVLVLEIINTIIEKVMDFITLDYNPKIKVIKDMSAGLVLIGVIVSVIVGLLIFFPKLLSCIGV